MYSLTLIKRSYFISTVLLNLILFPKLDFTYGGLYCLNILMFIGYYIVLRTQSSRGDSYYTVERLVWFLFGCGFIFITMYNIISFIYNQNYFVFSEADAGVYHLESIIMSNKSFSDSIHYFLNNWTFDDLGAVLVISSLYRLYISNLIVNIFYLILLMFSGLGMYKIGCYLMDKKYAYFAALTFSLSSFNIWYHSSGLKESVMIFLTIFSFLQYYHFMKTKSLKYLFYIIPFLLSLMFFRPAVMFLIVGSILISYLLGRKRNIIELLLIVVLIIGLIISYPYLGIIINKFIGSEGVYRMIESKELEGMVKGSVAFTYMVNILAGLIGPLPTILPNMKIGLSFYAPGLIYKALISIPFWFGIYTIYKRNLYIFYPIAIFVVLESASLILILEGLELRKSMPHLPFIYIVGFAFLSYIDNNNLILFQRNRIYNFFNTSYFVIFFLILYWNLRF